MPANEGTLGFEFAQPGRDRAGFRLDRQGKIAAVSGIEELGQSLTMLLSTLPGERTLQPEFGCPMDLIAFEPNDATTAGLAIRLVADAVERFEPRAEILSLDAYADPHSAHSLVLELVYRDRRDGATGQIGFTTDVAGGG